MYPTFLWVVVCAAVGIFLGVVIANWSFHDPYVVLGARTIFGVVGLIVGTTLGRWYVMRSANS